jgi:hypothetical protein
MIDFSEFQQRQEKHIKSMLEATTLYVVDVDPEVLYNWYLDSFPEGTNPVYKARRWFDCSCCRHYVKRFGNVVALKDGKIVTIWGFNAGDKDFQAVVDSLNELVSTAKIVGVFLSPEANLGTNFNFQQIENGSVIKWNHFHTTLPAKFVWKDKDTIGGKLADYRTNREMFEKSIQEISIDALETVLDLIAQNTLYKGAEWKEVLEKFLTIHKQYDTYKGDKNNYCWSKSIEVGPVISRIKNHSIGTLLLDLSNNVDIEAALRKYEVVVAPHNYKRPKAVFTKKMLEDAKVKVTELGYLNSLPRRFARLDDITINDVLFADRTVQKQLAGDVFAAMEKMAKSDLSPKAFDKVEQVPVEKFLRDVLPRVTSMSVLLENKHAGNMVSLIAPQHPTAPSMFKWGNNFSWAYEGNITDSSMKERVKAAGGKVDGVLRFSIQWNDDGRNNSDFDAHCNTPNGLIYFGRKHVLNGMLDVDIINPNGKIAVENITWATKKDITPGLYEFYLHCYHSRGFGGFSAEIEIDGQIHQFEYPNSLRTDERIHVANVSFTKAGEFVFTPLMKSTTSYKEIWGLTTNQFVPVKAMMFSPNFWGENKVGNQHLIFALDGCINPNQPNGFFNEFLDQRLNEHRKVFEALGSMMKVEPSDDQLSGLGFSLTKRAELVVKLEGHTSRVIKVVF